jgi:hypothetical protein
MHLGLEEESLFHLKRACLKTDRLIGILLLYGLHFAKEIESRKPTSCIALRASPDLRHSEMPFEVEAYAQVAGEEPMDFPVNPLALAKDMLAL